MRKTNSRTCENCVDGDGSGQIEHLSVNCHIEKDMGTRNLNQSEGTFPATCALLMVCQETGRQPRYQDERGGLRGSGGWSTGEKQKLPRPPMPVVFLRYPRLVCGRRTSLSGSSRSAGYEPKDGTGESGLSGQLPASGRHQEQVRSDQLLPRQSEHQADSLDQQSNCLVRNG
jgi:hypothetical protein